MRIELEIILSVLTSQRSREQMQAAANGDKDAAGALAERIAHCLSLTPMVMLVIFERCKQIVKGYDGTHDDMHTLGQLTMGAVCYAQTAFTQINSAKPLPTCFVHKDWPWERSSFHADQDPVGNLVKAAAMLIAEAGRIERERGDKEAGTAPPDDMFLVPLLKPGIDLAVKRDKPGQFLAAISGYMAAVLCEVKPARLEEALQSIEKFDEGQSAAMVAVQNATAAWVRAEMGLQTDPAYRALIDGKEDAKP